MLIFLTNGFGVQEKAKDLLQPYPQLKELVEIKVSHSADGQDYLLKLWEKIQRSLQLWNVTLEIGGTSETDGRKITIDSLVLKGEKRLMEGVLKHEVAHIIVGRTAQGGGENLPIVVELAATDTLFERETDARFLLPLLLPYVTKIDPVLGGHSTTLWNLSQSRDIEATFDLLLRSIAPPKNFQCGRIRGLPCFERLKESLIRAYTKPSTEEK